jgi:anti-sigma B factor antagonist
LWLVTIGRDEDLHIEIIERPSGTQLLILNGPLTLRTLFEFQEVARRHAGALVIDAAAVPYMDSAGLGALIGIYASCQRTGQGFAISSVPDRVQVLLEMTGVKGILPCFPSINEAEAAVIAP